MNTSDTSAPDTRRRRTLNVINNPGVAAAFAFMYVGVTLERIVDSVRAAHLSVAVANIVATSAMACIGGINLRRLARSSSSSGDRAQP